MERVKRKSFRIILSEGLVRELDDLADEVEATRSYVVEAILQWCFEEDVIDLIFPYEEGESEAE